MRGPSRGGAPCRARELADAVALAAADDVVVRLGVLEHHVHGARVVAGEAPVALGVEVAEEELFLLAQLDADGALGDLASDELGAATGRLVVEEDAAAGEDAVALAVVDGDVVAVDFGDALGAAGTEAGVLVLGGLRDTA